MDVDVNFVMHTVTPRRGLPNSRTHTHTETPLRGGGFDLLRRGIRMVRAGQYPEGSIQSAIFSFPLSINQTTIPMTLATANAASQPIRRVP